MCVCVSVLVHRYARTSYMSVAQNEKPRITQVLVFGSIYRRAILVHLFEPHAYACRSVCVSTRCPQVLPRAARASSPLPCSHARGGLHPRQPTRRSNLDCLLWLKKAVPKWHQKVNGTKDYPRNPSSFISSHTPKAQRAYRK